MNGIEIVSMIHEAQAKCVRRSEREQFDPCAAGPSDGPDHNLTGSHLDMRHIPEHSGSGLARLVPAIETEPDQELASCYISMSTSGNSGVRDARHHPPDFRPWWPADSQE
jgi:hypothetical protein